MPAEPSDGACPSSGQRAGPFPGRSIQPATAAGKAHGLHLIYRQDPDTIRDEKKIESHSMPDFALRRILSGPLQDDLKNYGHDQKSTQKERPL